MPKERAEAFFACLIARYRSLRIAPEAAYFVVARRREACQLAPSQHGGARSGANDDDGGGFSMFAPPICRKSWRNNAFRSASSDEDGGNPANIAASGASNRHSAMREQL
jgi:hypothetical protein